MAERTARPRDWFQIVSNVAIIVGLGLVIYELNQSKQLAHAQLTENTIDRMTAGQLALMGEDPRSAIARAALHPHDLDERDAVTLDAFYRTVTMGWSSYSRTAEIGNLDRDYEGIVRAQARMYFTSDPGRRWLNHWISLRRNWPPVQRIIEVVGVAVEDEAGESQRSSYEIILGAE